MNLATRMFFLPETLQQLLSTNGIKVNIVVCSRMSSNKRKYLQYFGEVINPMRNNLHKSPMTHLIIFWTLFKKIDRNLRNEVQKRTTGTCISNPVEYLPHTFFAKIVDD